MNIEKALRDYLNGTGPKVKNNTFFESIDGKANATINVLFKLVNEEIDAMSDSKILDRVVEVLNLIEVVINTQEDVNRKIIARKLNKLNEKLDRIASEGIKKFSNIRKIESEFNKVRRAISRLVCLTVSKESKQYDFMKFLIEETKNISYLEFALEKVPALANVRDKDNISLFRNIIENYVSSILKSNEEDALYFWNLINLFMSQKKFKITDIERRKIEEDIYKYINKLSYSKKIAKKNKDKIDLLTKLLQFFLQEEPKKDISSLASIHRIKLSFSPELIEQAKLARVPMEGQMTDRKVVDDFMISIDAEDAKELDDALTCKVLPNGNYLLGVHIASVLGYFPYDSEMVREALGRNHSIYLPFKYQSKDDDFNRVISIFPYAFSAQNGSLIAGEKRLARSYYFEIDPSGNVVNERFLKTIISNSRQLSFSEANKILEEGTPDKQLDETLKNLRDVSCVLAQKYQGTFLYDQLKENTDDYSELRVGKTNSEKIIYYSMLLTGVRVAEFFASHNYPFIYRVHEVNEENSKKIQGMIDTLFKTYTQQQIKNLYGLLEGIYPKGWYAMEGRHDGLNVDHYCHCTSLLRRATDIIVEHALEVCYDKEPTEEELIALREEIATRIVEINSKQPSIDYFVKEYCKRDRYRK